MRKNKREALQSEFQLLALDDDPIMTATIQSYFQGIGYNVDIENDPLTAIERIRTKHYDILLLDFLMTPLNGEQVVEKIREFNQELFIVLLTGHKSMAPPIRTIRSLDIQGYYEKSDRFDQLEMLVESCIKSIRQMRTIRDYQKGLSDVVERMPEIYRTNDVTELGQKIVDQLCAVCDCTDAILCLDRSLEIADSPRRYTAGTFFGEMDETAIYALINAAEEPEETGRILYDRLSDTAGRPVGILAAKRSADAGIYPEQLFRIFARQCEASLENSFLVTRVQENYLDVLRALRVMVDAKDEYTRGHSDRVSQYSYMLAKEIGLDPETCNRIRIAGQFHDIGKMAIPDRILLSSGLLSDEEFAVIRRHSDYGATILSEIPSLTDIVPIVKSHHERIDGAGYPLGLTGDEIPIESRIISIADTFDAMTSQRRYRGKLTFEEAVKRLRDAEGTQLDSKLVEVFLGLIGDSIPEFITGAEEPNYFGKKGANGNNA